MANLNRVQLIGRLGKEPEGHMTQKGTLVVRFPLAVNRYRKSGNETKEETDWFNVDTYGRIAVICNEYLHKGSLVFVEGRLQTDRYEKDGEIHYFTKVVAKNLQMLDRKLEEPVEVIEDEDPIEP